MPYTIDNPPDQIKALPKHAQKIWVNAYNAALIEYKGNEQLANQTAWAAVKKAGYKQDSDGKWVKVEGEILCISEQGELCSEQIDIKTDKIDIKKLTEGDSDPFFVIVKALKIGISGNRRRYTGEILQKVKSQLPVYGYLGHIKQEETSYKYRDPVTVWLAGEVINDWLYVKGYVPATEDRLRKQIKLSLQVGKPMPVSILGEYVMKQNRDIWDVHDIDPLISIDWAPSGLEGIKGAQVVSIGAEQTSNHKEDSMERAEIIASLTIDEIKKERPDLVTSLQSEMVQSDEAKKKQKELDDKVKTLEAENLKLKTDTLKAHRTTLLGEIKDEKIRNIADKLLTGETIEKLDESWKTVLEDLKKIEKPGMFIIGSEQTGQTKKGSDFLNESYCPEAK